MKMIRLRTRLLHFTVGLTALIAVVAVSVWWSPSKEERSNEGFWTCSMHPQVRRNGPGQCPICGMNLIPVSKVAKQASQLQAAGVETESIQRRRLFKEVGTVGKVDYSESQVAYIAARIDCRVERVFADVVGTDVRKGEHLVEVYSPGLNVDQATLIQSLQDVERSKDARAKSNLESARERLRLLGITEQQLAEIEQSRKTSNYLTIYAPTGGTIVEKNVRPGQYVSRGDVLYRIASLDPVWLFLEIYESDIGWVKHGQRADVRFEAYPGRIFQGIVSFIDPFLNDETRTVKIRVTLRNEDRQLKPAMYASAAIKVALRSDGTPEPTGLEGKYICAMHPDVVREEPGRCPVCDMELTLVPGTATALDAANLLATDRVDDHSGGRDSQPSHGTAHSDHQQPITDGRSTKITGDRLGVLALPASAVLDTGKRQVVYRRAESGAHELVEVRLGPRATAMNGSEGLALYFPVLDGLGEGDQVVVRGAFLLDSQRQIEGMPSLLYTDGRSAAGLHSGHVMPAPDGPNATDSNHTP